MNQIQQMREARGLTKTELAELAGVTRQTVSRVEQGRLPYSATVTRLTEALTPVGHMTRLRQACDLALTALTTDKIADRKAARAALEALDNPNYRARRGSAHLNEAMGSTTP